MKLIYASFLLCLCTTFTAFSQKISLLKDFSVGLESAFFVSAMPFVGKINNTVIIKRRLGSDKYELWKSEGTTNGTIRIQDIPFGSEPTDFVVIGKIMYYVIVGFSAEELWQTDGTLVGTVKLSKYYSIDKLVPFRGSIYYNGYSDLGQGMHKYDIKTKSETLIHEDSSVKMVTAVDSTHLILLSGSPKFYVMKSDGTKAGTTNVSLLNDGDLPASYKFFPTVVGKKVFFFQDNPIGSIKNEGRYLYVTDGTATGTTVLKGFRDDSSPNLVSNRAAIAYKNKFIFAGNNTSTFGNTSLWASDGTIAGTTKIDPTPTGDLVPSYFTIYNDVLYFMGAKNSTYYNIYKTDGTKTGTKQALEPKDVNSNHYSLGGFHMTLFKSKLHFIAYQSSSDIGIGYSDGTPLATKIIDVLPNAQDNSSSYLFATDKILYFTAKIGVETGVFTFDPLGVSNKDLEAENSKWSIYPNPATDMLNINVEAIDNLKSINISTIEGKMVQSFNPSSQIDISQLSKGCYIIQLVTADGVLSKKLIK